MTRHRHSGNGSYYVIKDNGLPEGEGLFWINRDRKYIYAKIDGLRYPCKTNDWQEAVTFLEKKRAELKEGHDAAVNGDVRVNDLLDAKLRYYKRLAEARGEYGSDTEYQARKQLAMKGGIRDTFGKLKVSQLKVEMYDTFRDKWKQRYLDKGSTLDAALYSANRHLDYLRAALIAGQEAMTVSSTVAIPRGKNRSAVREAFIDDTTYESLVNTLPDYARLPFAVCVDSGFRKKEIRFARRSEVQWDRRVIKLREKETKANKARGDGMSQTVWDLILEWEAKTVKEYPKCEWLFHRYGVRLTTKQLDLAFQTACQNLGLHVPKLDEKGLPVKYKDGKIKYDRSKVHWHDTRRTAITNSNNLDGISDIDRQRTTGTSPETQKRYDQNESEIKHRDAKDRFHARKNGLLDIVPSSAVVVPCVTDKTSQLKELKFWLDAGLIPEDIYKAGLQKIVLAG